MGDFLPRGGTGGNFGKKDRTHTLVMCQTTYIPSFKTIGVNCEIFESRGESPPLLGEEMRMNFGKLKRAFVK